MICILCARRRRRRRSSLSGAARVPNWSGGRPRRAPTQRDAGAPQKRPSVGRRRRRRTWRRARRQVSSSATSRQSTSVSALVDGSRANAKCCQDTRRHLAGERASERARPSNSRDPRQSSRALRHVSARSLAAESTLARRNASRRRHLSPAAACLLAHLCSHKLMRPNINLLQASNNTFARTRTSHEIKFQHWRVHARMSIRARAAHQSLGRRLAARSLARSIDPSIARCAQARERALTRHKHTSQSSSQLTLLYRYHHFPPYLLLIQFAANCSPIFAHI